MFSMSWLPRFVGFAIIPVFLFFLYGVIQIENAGRVVSEQKEAIKIIDGEAPVSIRSETNKNLAEIYLDIKKVVDILEPENQVSNLSQASLLLRDGVATLDSIVPTFQAGSGLIERSEKSISKCDSMSNPCFDELKILRQEIKALKLSMAVKFVDEGVYDVHFSVNSYELLPQVENALNYIINSEKARGRDAVYLFGYADLTGYKTQNCLLSENRAKAVKNLMEGNVSYLKSIAIGDAGVPYLQIDGESEPKNRIVRIIFHDGRKEFNEASCLPPEWF